MASTTTAPVILVISGDEFFANPLAQQVKNALSLPCAIAKSVEAAKPLPASVSLVVTNEPVRDVFSCPVIVLKQPPFRMQDILQDILAVRQKQGGDEMPIGCSYRLQPRQKELVHVASGKTVSLTDKEVKLLQSLGDAAGKVVSKDQLHKQVWDMEAVLDTHTLETHIYRLRAKFRELADDDIIIAEGGGYKLDDGMYGKD